VFDKLLQKVLQLTNKGKSPQTGRRRKMIKEVILEKELTPAEKARRTRAQKKADAAYEEMVAPAYTKWVEALDRNCPIRDAYIAKLEAKRDAAIAEINRQFEEDYAIQMAQYNHMMKPTQDVLDEARANAWTMHKDAIMGRNY
jgi:hypothetical protein